MKQDDALEPVLQCLRAMADHGHRVVPDAAAWRYHSWAELVLDVGRVFVPPAVPDPTPAERRGPGGTCYTTAAYWSMDDGVPYVEGWASNGSPVTFLGTEHAWNLTASGATADPTWTPGSGLAYVGVPFTAAYRRHVHSPQLLTAHEHGLALLRDGVPDDILVAAGDPVPPVPPLTTEWGIRWTG